MIVRSAKEESWNVATHFVGMIAAVAGAVWICLAVGDKVLLPAGAACVIYAVILIMTYAMSTASHWFTDPVEMQRFRSLDQAFIYLLIVGTYMPFSLHFWNHTNANLLLAAMWCIAITGFLLKVGLRYRVSRVSVLGYVMLGWMPVLGLPLHDDWPIDCFYWILAGGIVYSGGTIFLLNDRRAIWCHPVWHVCVVTASVVHFAAMLKFVVSDL